MIRDKSIYDKYLNMEIKKPKKLDFSVKFDSKIQKFGLIIFGIGLILLCSGIILIVFKYHKAAALPDKTIIANANVQDFPSMKSSDGLFVIEPFTVIYRKKTGLTEVDFKVNFFQKFDEYPLKIIFTLDGKEVVLTDYLTDGTPGGFTIISKQSEYDLSRASDCRIEKTTKEDLRDNYGYPF